MNSNEILRMVVKLTGLAIFLSGLILATSYFPLIYEAMMSESLDTSMAIYISSILSPVIIGLLLWFFPAPVANTVIKNDLEVTSKNDFIHGIENIGIRILGIYLLYHGISDLVFNIMSYRQEIELVRENINILGKGNTKVALIVTGVEIILSIFLIFGANVISTFIRRIKFAS